MGYQIGTSILDEESIDLAASLMKEAEEKKVRMLLPKDVICGEEFKNDTKTVIWLGRQHS